MSTPPATTGTTLHLMNLYFAHGVLAQKIGSSQQIRVTALHKGNEHSYAEFKNMHTALLSDLLPVLRPYAALSHQLADQTIPAIMVARLLCDDRDDDFSYTLASVGDLPPVVNVFQRALEGGQQLRNTLKILPNWNFAWLNARGDEDRMRNVLEAYDYLRSLLFATPVGGHKLREGVDFVALVEQPPVTVPA